MSVTDDDLRAVWQHGSTNLPSDRSGCLGEVEWARLLTKEASEQERARAADHIGSCTQCADEYRLVLPLQSWATEVQQALPRDKQALRGASHSWRRWLALPRPAVALAAVTVLLVLQAVPLYLFIESRREKQELEAQLGQEKETLSSTRASLATLQEELRRRPAAPTAEQLDALQRGLAPPSASQQRLALMSAPQLGVPILDLEPRNTGSVRGSADPQVVTPHRDASFVALILNFPPLTSRSTLEVEVTDENGHARWVSRTVGERSTASLTLALPTAGYPAGRYDVRIFDVTKGRTLFVTYAVSIGAARAKGP